MTLRRRLGAIGGLLLLASCGSEAGSGPVGTSALAGQPGTIVWDWNDGTTQGWTSVAGSSNVGNRFRGTNNTMNGTLQLENYAVDPGRANWTSAGELSFDIEIESFSTAVSPAELTQNAVHIRAPDPGLQGLGTIVIDGVLGEVTFWQFGLTYHVVVPDLQTAGTVVSSLVPPMTRAEILANVDQVGIYITEPGAVPNNSAALLDDFVVQTLPDVLPAAVADTLETAEDTASAPLDVLANDTGLTDGVLTVATYDLNVAEHGTVAVNGDNTITYTPAADYAGPDDFDYQVCDGDLGTPDCATATVSITVTPVDDPVPGDDDDDGGRGGGGGLFSCSTSARVTARATPGAALLVAAAWVFVFVFVRRRT